MSYSPLEYLQHMLTEAEFLIAQTRTLSKDDFLHDEVLRRALVRSIEIIGEAARQVPRSSALATHRSSGASWPGCETA